MVISTGSKWGCISFFVAPIHGYCEASYNRYLGIFLLSSHLLNGIVASYMFCTNGWTLIYITKWH